MRTPLDHSARPRLGRTLLVGLLLAGSFFACNLETGPASTAEGLVASLNEAVAEEPADLAFVFRQIRSEDPEERRMLHSFADFYSAVTELEVAATEAFGDGVYSDLASLGDLFANMKVELLKSDREEGVIRMTQGDDGSIEEMRIFRADGRWWIDGRSASIASEFSSAPEDQETVRQMEHLAAAFETTHRRLREGEFESKAELESGLEEEVLKAVTASEPPSDSEG